MRNESWLEALDHDLTTLGVKPMDRAAVLVETEGFLDESRLRALDHFGAPEDYASVVASALGGEPCRSPATVDQSAGDQSAVGEPAVAVSGLSKSYRGRVVLDEVTLKVPKGGLVALTGPNGAGKSTLLRIIAGIESADAGTVEVAGAIGYVPQSGGLDPYLSPSDHFALFGAAADRTRRDAIREGNRLAKELGWDAAAAPTVGQLSGGTEQKLSVIVALLGDPEVLLLDEPYQGMDAESTRRFWELLWAWQDNGGSSLVSSHSPDALRKASAVVEIEGLPAR